MLVINLRCEVKCRLALGSPVHLSTSVEAGIFLETMQIQYLKLARDVDKSNVKRNRFGAKNHAHEVHRDEHYQSTLLVPMYNVPFWQSGFISMFPNAPSLCNFKDKKHAL